MNKIYIIGDLHGDYKPIKNLNNTCSLSSTDTVIVLGDFGANYFFNYRDKKYKEKLCKYPNNYFIIRGNHEERPSICAKLYKDNWHKENFWGNIVYVENDYPNIKYALDTPEKYLIPTSLNNKTIKTLILPGAYSVDKYYRIANKHNWFENEQCTEKEMEKGTLLAKLQEWDLILSHTCPAIYEPTDLFLSVIDQATVDKTTERWLGNIEYNAKYNLWCWGHFHQNRIYPNVDNKNKLMLFNDCVLDLYEYFENNTNIYKNLIKITKSANIKDFNVDFL